MHNSYQIVGDLIWEDRVPISVQLCLACKTIAAVAPQRQHLAESSSFQCKDYYNYLMMG